MLLIRQVKANDHQRVYRLQVPGEDGAIGCAVEDIRYGLMKRELSHSKTHVMEYEGSTQDDGSK